MESFECVVFLVQEPAPGYQTKDHLGRLRFPCRIPLINESVKLHDKYFRIVAVAHTPNESCAAELFVRGPINHQGETDES